MFRVNKGRFTAAPLCLCDNVQGKRGFTRRLRAVNLNYPSFGQSADSKRHVQRKGTRGDHIHALNRAIPKAHNAAFSVCFFNLCDCGIERFLFITGRGRGQQRGLLSCHCHILLCADFYKNPVS